MASLIFGKVFATMFTGSMYGSGAPVFAVMTYVIANMQPGRDRVEFVRLNPQVLADTIGEDKETIQQAIDFLCGKDDESNHKEEVGKRLVLEGPYLYRVVNGQYYRELKDEEDRLAKDAVRAARYRDRKKQQVVLTGEDAAAHQAAAGKSRAKRLKVVENAGIKAGAQEVINEALPLPATNGNLTGPDYVPALERPLLVPEVEEPVRFVRPNP